MPRITQFGGPQDTFITIQPIQLTRTNSPAMPGTVVGGTLTIQAQARILQKQTGCECSWDWGFQMRGKPRRGSWQRLMLGWGDFLSWKIRRLT